MEQGSGKMIRLVEIQVREMIDERVKMGGPHRML